MKVSKLNPNAASFVPTESINTNPSPPPSDHDHHRRRSRPRPRPRNNNDDAVVVAVGPRKNSGKVWRPKTMLHNNIIIIGSTSTQPASSSSFTTLMIKNVPSRYTREMLIEFVDNFCKLENDDDHHHIYSAYDFLYLPMDFRRKLNKGYAFVNFTDARAALKFWEAMDHKKWDYFRSPKIRQIVHATIQGREALERRFRKSEFCCEFEEYLPISFCPPRDGSNGLQSCGTNIGRVMIGSTNNY
ncbi:hypothetical protein CsatB_015526 [Cannabis sativa]|uniref:protein terminal ear1 homolog n=1 Tax=Cannabis sativa TaxID=3483 RepID=UPI0029C9FECE|nr:protein terminal ear1 homolog [Cannabis sativa]